jgi:hypothetical protein
MFIVPASSPRADTYIGFGRTLQEPCSRLYQELRALLAKIAELAPRLSPARFFFIHRLVRRSGLGEMLLSQGGELALTRLENAAERKAQLKLQRLHLEMNLGVGTFVLLGSISGWMLLCSILIRVAFRKVTGRSAYAPTIFDLAEKLISRIGFDALNLARSAGRC